MTLFVQEFRADFNNGVLWQPIKVKKHVNLAYIRPHLFRYNQPTGTLRIVIMNLSQRIMHEGEKITITDVFSNSFAHGYYPMKVGYSLAPGNYLLGIKAGDGYDFSSGAYAGWVNGFDLKKYLSTYTINETAKEPLDFEAFSFGGKYKMRVLDFNDGFETNGVPTVTNIAQQELIANILNGQDVAANVTGMIANESSFHKVTFKVRVYRKTDLEERAETFFLNLEYMPDLGEWIGEIESRNNEIESGVTFTIQESGQVQYVSDTIAGSNYEGYAKWTVETLEKE
jgi:hypothetical protein